MIPERGRKASRGVLWPGRSAAPRRPRFCPRRSDAAEDAASSSQQTAEARTEALVEAALSATPATLTAEQRLDVRRGVRDLQKALADARRVALPYETDPATVFLPEGRR